MKYTKGEWKVRHPINCDYLIYTGEYGKGITQVAQIIESYPNAEANAYLIAAAPDMYEALKGLAIAYNVDGEGVIVNQDPHYWQQALKAIAKAEGKGD